MSKRFALLILLFFSIPAFADDTSAYGPALESCITKADGVTGLMRDCVLTEYKLADKNLNDTYKKLLPMLSNRARKNYGKRSASG